MRRGMAELLGETAVTIGHRSDGLWGGGASSTVNGKGEERARWWVL